MARIAKAVAPGMPHHITQGGDQRQQTFFCDEDYHLESHGIVLFEPYIVEDA